MKGLNILRRNNETKSVYMRYLWSVNTTVSVEVEITGIEKVLLYSVIINGILNYFIIKKCTKSL